MSHYSREPGFLRGKFVQIVEKSNNPRCQPRQTGAMPPQQFVPTSFSQTRFRCYFLFRYFFLLPPHPLGRRCQGLPMVGTKGFSGPPGKPCRWQTITSQITAPLALPPPRRYPRPSAPPWPAGYLWVPRVPMGIPGLQHCGLLGTTAITRVTMVALAVVILVSFLLLTITDSSTTLFLQRRLTSTSQLSPLSFLTCLTFPHHGPLLVTT